MTYKSDDFFKQPSDFWEKLEQDSNQFQNPSHYKKLFRNSEAIENAIRSTLSLYAKNTTIQQLSPSLRLFVDNKAEDLQRYFNPTNCIRQEESIEDWGNRVFENRKYILVINCIERFSDEIASRFASFMQPYLKNKSIEELSFRISLFIGNSGFTPFGAHIDVPGLEVTHFHLGPGSKSMILWEEKQFHQLTQSREKHHYNYGDQLAQGKSYQLEKGDVFFFPADRYYHVGEYHDFSMAAAVGIMKESAHSLYKKALSIWEEDNKGHFNKTVATKDTTPQLPSQQIPEEVLQTSIVKIIEAYKRKKESNLFMHHRPVLKNLRAVFLLNRRLRLNTPFKIQLSTDRTELYSRGRKIERLIDDESECLINDLNQGKTVVCHKEMAETTLNLITWLFNTGSIVFDKSAHSNL